VEQDDQEERKKEPYHSSNSGTRRPWMRLITFDWGGGENKREGVCFVFLPRDSERSARVSSVIVIGGRAEKEVKGGGSTTRGPLLLY